MSDEKPKDQAIIRREKMIELGKETQWKPGQSGNPKGRPPDSERISTMALKAIDEMCPFEVGPFPAGTKKWRELIRDGWLAAMANQNMKALEMFLDRTEGKVTQGVKLEEGSELTIHAVSPLERILGQLARIEERRRALGDPGRADGD